MFKKFLAILNDLVTQVEQQTHFKLKAFSEANLKVVYEQLDYLASDTAKFLEIHRHATQTFAQCKPLQNQEGKADTQESETQKTQFFALSKEVLQFLQVKNAREWYEKYCALFTTQSTWWDERLSQLPLQTSSHALDTINQLRQLWQQQGHYAVFSTPDLIGAYWRNVSVIETWLKSAQQEFLHQYRHQQKQLPYKLVRQYQTQFHQLTTALQAEKATMRASMIVRLAVGIKRGDLRFDDAVVSTVQALEKLGALDSTPLPKGIRRHITPSILRYIQQIIAIDGTAAEKAQLATLLYSQFVKQKSKTSTQKITSAQTAISLVARKNHFGITFAVPETVSHLVAAQPPFYTKLPKSLQFLFRGAKAAYEFFQHEDCQYLLIAQNHFAHHTLEPNLNIRTLRHSSSWDYFNDLTHLVASETKRLNTKQASLSRIWHPDVHRLLQGYKTALTTFSHRLYNQQLQVFDWLLTDLEVQIKTRVSHVLSEAEQLGIEAVKDQLVQYQKAGGIAVSNVWRSLLARYQHLIKLAATAKSQVTDADLAQTTQVIQKIKHGKKLGSREQMLLTEVERSSLNSYSNAFSSCATVATQPTYAQTTFALNYRVAQQDVDTLLKTTLMQSALTLSSPELVEHLQALKQHFETLVIVQPTLIHSTDIQTALYRYFYTLLETIQNLPGRSAFTKLEGHAQFILQTLLQLPLDETLHHEVLQLQQSIESFKALDWHLFQQLVITPRLKALSAVLNTATVISEISEVPEVSNEPLATSTAMNIPISTAPLYVF